LRVEASRGGQAWRQPPKRRGRRRGMDVDARQVDRPVTDHGVQVIGVRRRRFRPARLVPAMPPDKAVGVGLCELGDEREAVPRRGGDPQIEARKHEAGGGDMHMAVDEGGCDDPLGT